MDQEIETYLADMIRPASRYHADPEVEVLSEYFDFCTCECLKCHTVFDFDTYGVNGIRDDSGEYLTPACPDCDLPINEGFI